VKRSAFMVRVTAVIDWATLFSARVVAGILVAMMVLTSADVFLRSFFARSIVGTLEIESNYFMAAIIFLPLAYGMTSRQGHIRVDLFTSRLPPRVRKGLEVLGLILSLLVFGLISGYGFAGAWRSWAAGERMVNIVLPLWPGRALVGVGGTLLCLQMIARLLHLLKPPTET
jgi:TRAP-type mannitol/chloroaromatic compound transport system permease small subunit